jgi:hypothetical protein
MAISTFFTLFVVPCIYSLIAGTHKAGVHAADEIPAASLRMA